MVEVGTIDSKGNEIKTIENNSFLAPTENWEENFALVKEITAKNLTEVEFRYLWFMAKSYGLNPLKKQVWAVKYGTAPAQVFISRDGYLDIGHRSKQFGCMKTTFIMNEKIPTQPYSATTQVWRKDYDKPFENTVLFQEYNLKQSVWLQKPVTMLCKVSESQTLRKAFGISGAYDPSELPDETEAEVNGNKSVKRVLENGTNSE
jgi:phage recombination protein Bet